LLIHSLQARLSGHHQSARSGSFVFLSRWIVAGAEDPTLAWSVFIQGFLQHRQRLPLLFGITIFQSIKEVLPGAASLFGHHRHKKLFLDDLRQVSADFLPRAGGLGAQALFGFQGDV